jgi:hypothetical protein
LKKRFGKWETPRKKLEPGPKQGPLGFLRERPMLLKERKEISQVEPSTIVSVLIEIRTEHLQNTSSRMLPLDQIAWPALKADETRKMTKDAQMQSPSGVCVLAVHITENGVSCEV